MVDYVISDLHLDHDNIIEYCNRPFENVEEMNEELINRWNNTVSQEETVLYLGDLAMANEEIQNEYLELLHGDIIFIKGNHDDVKITDTAAVSVFNGVEITDSETGLNFYASHKPFDADQSFMYILHGHTHNNKMMEFPFYEYHKKTVNVSAELIGYTPLRFDELTSVVRNANESIQTYEKHT